MALYGLEKLSPFGPNIAKISATVDVASLERSCLKSGGFLRFAESPGTTEDLVTIVTDYG